MGAKDCNPWVTGDLCIPNASGQVVKKHVGMATLKKQLWAIRAGKGLQVRQWALCTQVHSPLPHFWVNLALPCSLDQSAARQINGANKLEKNQILASVMIEFPKVSDAVSHFKITGFQDKAGG